MHREVRTPSWKCLKLVDLRQAERYIEGVLSGELVTCKWVRLAVERHVNDLKREDWEWTFDEKKADRAVSIIKLLRHTKGREFARKHFMLQDWQAFILHCIFGWVHKETGFRRFRKAYVETAKKSGKSEFAAAIMILGFLFDNEYGAQCHSAATKRDQAMYVFQPAKTMLKFLREDSPGIRKLVDINQHRVYCEETASYISPLSSDHNSLDGVDSHFSIVDEFHAHKTSGLNDNLENSSVSRQNSLLFQITTAGFNLDGPCYYFRENVVTKVLEGIKQAERLFAIVFTLDEDDDWNNSDTWVKANPGLGQSPKLENLLPLYTKAKNLGGTAEVDFKTKNLNIWCSSSETWLPDDVWMEGDRELDFDYFKGKTAVIGMDLGQTQDLTAAAIVFDPDECDGEYHVLMKFWCSEETAKKRQEQGDNYIRWGSEGHLTITPGNVTDYSYIIKELDDLREHFKIKRIDYDPHNASHLANDLTSKGFKMERFNQYMRTMNTPTRELEDLVHDRKLIHYGHPVLRWMNANVEIIRSAEGYIKISKKKEHKKVDGMVAVVMALGGMHTWKAKKHPYQHRGIRTV